MYKSVYCKSETSRMLYLAKEKVIINYQLFGLCNFYAFVEAARLGYGACVII